MKLRNASVLLALAAATVALVACGSDTTETVTDTEQVAPATTSSTAPATSTTTTPTSTTSTTTAGANCDYNKGEIYSAVSGTCVQQSSGSNPCPPGEVPMADQATCVKADDQNGDSTTG